VKPAIFPLLSSIAKISKKEILAESAPKARRFSSFFFAMLTASYALPLVSLYHSSFTPETLTGYTFKE
jgi:hypothetical protein